MTSIVLVHGGFVDGSGWEAVYQILRKAGHAVTVVQNPPPDLMGAAQVLIQNGCKNQLELLVQSASKSTK